MTTERPRWAAVIVNYEGGPLLTDAVRSLRDDASAGAPELVVVDNGSSDGSVDALRAAVRDVEIVTPAHNLGYAGAANAGTQKTGAPVVAVCNCDIQVRPGTASAILQRFDADPRVAAVGPTVHNTDGTRYPSARSVPRLRDAIGHGIFGLFAPNNRFTRRYRELDTDPTRTREVDWVSGSMIWLRRAAVDQIGGWDDGYFMYVEDVDLCWRLRCAGWRVVFEPAGEVTHVQGASTDRRPYRMLLEHHRSLLRFAAKRWTGWRRVLLVPAAAYLSVRTVITVLLRALTPHRSRQRSTPSNG